MIIDSLKLENFRNIASMDFTPSAGANIIFGNNAQGKTNLLEAIWLFSGARSFRGGKDAELVRFGQPVCLLHLDFCADGREQTASIAIGANANTNNNKKNVLLNGIKLAGAGKLAGEFCVVLFSPDHLLLVKQGPESRRRMIDISLSQAYPKYARILDSYQKILKQRASLLRDIPRNAALLDILDAWDKSLVEYGGYITAVRTGYVKRLADHAREIYGGISGGREALDIFYRQSLGENTEGFTRRDFTDCLGKAVRRSRGEDIAQGKTTVGPHRDDLDILIDGTSARSFGSQGQQRSCVLALKLAECGILEERNKEPPVVLLDDVMSELDEFRRGFLLNKLKDKQILITCCDASLFSGLEGGAIHKMENGRLAGLKP